MSDFNAELDRLHESGKVNGLLMAQVIAMEVAVDAVRSDVRETAQHIADLIGEAAKTRMASLPPPAELTRS